MVSKIVLKYLALHWNSYLNAAPGAAYTHPFTIAMRLAARQLGISVGERAGTDWWNKTIEALNRQHPGWRGHIITDMWGEVIG